jgi:hypothetical protein
MDRFWVLVALADLLILGAVTAALSFAFNFRILIGSHLFAVPRALMILATWGLLAGAVTISALIVRSIVRRY